MATEKNVHIEKPAVEKFKDLSSQSEQITKLDDSVKKNVAVLEKPAVNLESAIRLEPKQSNGSNSAMDFQQQRAVIIDNILASGLNDVFIKLKADEQQAFKQKGEETVKQINELLNKTKVKINKIISLIRAWLKLIPGINKFFLEQEAKIKADKILRIKDKF